MRKLLMLLTALFVLASVLGVTACSTATSLKVVTLRPNGGGDITQLYWRNNSDNQNDCNSSFNQFHEPDPNMNWQMMCDTKPDYCATHIDEHCTLSYDLYNISELPSSFHGLINSVSVHVFACSVGCPKGSIQVGLYPIEAWIVIKTHGTEYQSLIALQSWQDQYATWNTNPYTGEAWTQEEINSLQIGIKLYINGLCQCPTSVGITGSRATQEYAVVSWHS